jgi:murein L,D-transpeptidase YafK
MRPIHRYSFPIRRALQHARVDFRVWRQNREVAAAFRDPILEGPGFIELLAGRLRAPWAAWAAGLVLAVSAGLAYKGLSTGAEGDPFKGEAGAHSEAAGDGLLADVPAAAGPDGGRNGEGGILAMVSDSAALGVNMAIVLEAAGLDAAPRPGPEPAPAALPERYNALVACKRDRTLYVYEREAKGKWTKRAAFPMAFGRRGGDKADAGDRRTPEGRYWITSMLSGPSQGPLYGPLVFTLNYPTPGDLAEGKGGDGIWIHGVEAGKGPTSTRGCLALANDDVLELSKYADIGTPVLILPDTLHAEPSRQFDETGMAREYPALMAAHARRGRADTLARERALAEARAFLAKEAREHPAVAEGGLSPEDREAILARLARWREDWTRRDAEAYAGNYSEDFQDRNGRGREEFLERKRRIFASKTRITMDMHKPEIQSEGRGKANVTFRQEYAAEGGEGIQRSSGTKTVWLEQGPGGWLIVRE